MVSVAKFSTAAAAGICCSSSSRRVKHGSSADKISMAGAPAPWTTPPSTYGTAWPPSQHSGLWRAFLRLSTSEVCRSVTALQNTKSAPHRKECFCS
jgi:hypothetical protein